MKASSTFLPTRREVIFLGSLLAILLFITNSDLATNSALSLRDFSRFNEAQSSPKTEVALADTYPIPRLTWTETESVPETKMLQHVEGELSCISALSFSHCMQDGQFSIDCTSTTAPSMLSLLTQSPSPSQNSSRLRVPRSTTVKKTSSGGFLLPGTSAS